MKTLLAATMFTLALGTAAFAQSSSNSGATSGGQAEQNPTGENTMKPAIEQAQPNSNDSGTNTMSSGSNMSSSSMGDDGGMMMKNWKGPIGQAFFTDDSMKTMRSQDDMSKNYAALTPQQKEQIANDCKTSMTGNKQFGGNMAEICKMTSGANQ